MRSLLGPILYIGNCDESTWEFRVHLLLEGTADAPENVNVTCEGASVKPPEKAFTFDNYGEEDEGATYWNWAVEAHRADDDRWLTYRVTTDDEESVKGVRGWRFPNVCIPREGALPNIAFFSCNGRSHESDYRLGESERLWRHLHKKHESHREDDERGFNLLVGGGDQIYADELWRRKPLKTVERKAQEKEEFRPEPTFGADVLEKYVDLYIDHWSRPHMRDVFARVPGAFTWDDHDIMDGWGSTYETEQTRETLPKLSDDPSEEEVAARSHLEAYQEIYEAARDAFVAFQLGGDMRPHVRRKSGSERHFLQRLSFRGAHARLDVLVLDIRSERTRDQVLSEEQWAVLEEELGELASESDPSVRSHLLLVSSIPLLHRRYYASQTLDDAAALLTLKDDMIDQWEHGNHAGERKDLIEALLRHARAAGSRVTILSGDVHVGTRGRIESTAPGHRPTQGPEGKAIIDQITSSGIGHPPPKGWKWGIVKALSQGDEDTIGDEATGRMLEVSRERPYLRARNWLAARFDEPTEAEIESSLREPEGTESSDGQKMDGNLPTSREEGLRLRCQWFMEDEQALGEWMDEHPGEREKARWDQGIPGMEAISKKAVLHAYATGDLA